MKNITERPNSRRLAFIGSIVILFISPALIQAQTVKLKVKVNTANIKLNPDPNSPTIRIVGSGVLLDSDGEFGDFYRLRMIVDEKGSYVVGYILKLLVEKIVEPQIVYVPVNPPPEKTPPAAVPEKPGAVGAQAPVAETEAPFYEKISIIIGGSYLKPSDNNFNAIYPDAPLYPEFRLNFTIKKELYFWGSFGWFSSIGRTLSLQEVAHADQKHYCGGLGFNVSLSPRARFDIRGGVFYSEISENAMGETLTNSAIGYTASGGLRFYLFKNVFFEIEGEYAAAAVNSFDPPLKIGGFKAGAGIGLAF